MKLERPSKINFERYSLIANISYRKYLCSLYDRHKCTQTCSDKVHPIEVLSKVVNVVINITSERHGTNVLTCLIENDSNL